jgi:hypothetical protein
MQNDYLEQLPENVQSLVKNIERQIGFEISVAENPYPSVPDSFRGA